MITKLLNIGRDISGRRQVSVKKALDGTDGDVHCESFAVYNYDHNIYVNETKRIIHQLTSLRY